MKNKSRILTLIFAVVLCMAAFPLTAYAGGGEETPEPQPTETPAPVAAPNPFTPAGTGTVIDNATDADGKEFFTIMTPNENVFYLIIDRQRETENVYFLNAVTEKDLLALAELSEEPNENIIPPTPVSPEPTPEPTPESAPEPEKGGGMGMMIIVALVVLAGGGAAYYFKIYRPKQLADTGDDYDEYEAGEADTYGEDAEPEDDGPPWYENEDERGGDGEA